MLNDNGIGNKGQVNRNNYMRTESDSVPYNVLNYNAFSIQKKSLDMLQDKWLEWKRTGPSLFIAPIVGIVGIFLLKQLASFAVKRILNALWDLVFPSSDISLMQEVLKSTEAFLNQKLSQENTNRINAELQGLQASIKEFNEQVDDSLNPHSPTTPNDIIDSVNAMQLVFVNRIPQFRLQGSEILLLPQFAQAATLHLTFVRDVIINAEEWEIPSVTVQRYRELLKEYTREYSNYCMNTYQKHFQGLNTNIQDLLEFRTFMVLNVLEYVSAWSMFKYQSIIITSSANLYAAGKPEEGIVQNFTAKDWPFLNSLFQVNSNYILSGFRGYRYSGLSGINIYSEWLLNFVADYTGGISSGRISNPTINDFNFHCSLNNPVVEPYVKSWIKSSVYKEHGKTFEHYSGAFKKEIGMHCGAFSPRDTEVNYFPEYYIRNISGITRVFKDEDLRRPLHFNEIRHISSTSMPGSAHVTSLVSVHNRKDNISHVNQNGTMVHLAPREYIGFTMSPIHANIVNYQNKVFISEKFGNQGDSLRFDQSSSVWYTFKGNGNYYKIYLRLSSLGNSNIGVNINNQTYTVKNINTITHNDGIIDNNARFSDIYIGSVLTVDSTDTTFNIDITLESGTQFELMNILFLPTNIEPLY
ncbi:insecticidal delta-endotoxin Cry8Ea1 family protein [Bacillus thuringiensis]|uniref:insecticidal delta-endotoxin Cry8Ea1 family protein n=1 Tax=Bacillus thuringiensis TaxID=1428 RepID=UPI003CE80A01